MERWDLNRELKDEYREEGILDSFPPEGTFEDLIVCLVRPLAVQIHLCETVMCLDVGEAIAYDLNEWN